VNLDGGVAFLDAVDGMLEMPKIRTLPGPESQPVIFPGFDVVIDLGVVEIVDHGNGNQASIFHFQLVGYIIGKPPCTEISIKIEITVELVPPQE